MQDLPYELPFLPTSPPNTPTHWCLPTSRRCLWKQKLEASAFLGKVGTLFFLMMNFLPLLHQRHFTSCWLDPSIHQFKPKRHPWPHQNNDSTNSRLCIYFLPLPKCLSSAIDQIFAFRKADNICELINFSHKLLSPCAIYLKSTKANWFLPWQPDPGSQLSALLQFLVSVFVLDSFDLENKGE